MSHYVLYYLSVKKDRQEEFLDAWQTFSSEVKLSFGAYGAMLFRTQGGDYVVVGRWPDKEVWDKFWVTKELEVESLTRLKGCLSGPTEPVVLDKLFDNWSL